MKETYEKMKIILDKIQYEKYSLNLCGAFNVLLCCFVYRLDTQSYAVLFVNVMVEIVKTISKEVIHFA